MKILGLVAENYKKLRVVEIHPKGRLIQITGKNGQGKTSVLDALWAAVKGKAAMPDKPVRKGSEKARLQVTLGDGKAELLVTRTISASGAQVLTVESAKGVKVTSPQAMLDSLVGELSFDPLAFVAMAPKQQVETLRKVADIGLDVDALNAASAQDFEERTAVNREVKRLEAEVASIVVQDGLPKEKLDEAAVLQELASAGEANKKIEQVRKEKDRLEFAAKEAAGNVVDCEMRRGTQEAKISDLEREMERAKDQLLNLQEERDELLQVKEAATEAFLQAPHPEFIEISKVAQLLQTVQLTNREIDKRARREAVEKTLQAEKRKALELTRAIEQRVEEKTAALANAKMPVEGLSFSEDNQVLYKGIPLEQLGEAEQIRISTKIAMAANPKLRVLRIMHGEALDDESLEMLAQMAEENDFDIWMAKVDSTGKVGIVMEDGMVKSEE